MIKTQQKMKYATKSAKHISTFLNTNKTLQITFRSMELIKDIASMKIFKGHEKISKKEACKILSLNASNYTEMDFRKK